MTDLILQNKEHFDRKVQDIRNHPDISTEAKRPTSVSPTRRPSRA